MNLVQLEYSILHVRYDVGQMIKQMDVRWGIPYVRSSKLKS